MMEYFCFMNEKVLKTLEYNKILNQLSEYACSPEAKKRCLALRPITDKAQIEQLQLQTKDALSRLFRCGNLSFSGVHSVNDSLKRLEIGASLSAAELLSICSLLEAAKRVKAFSRSEKEEVPDDSLTGFFTEIEPLTPLYDEIKRCILAEDEIADDASSTLRSIRRSMRGMIAQIERETRGPETHFSFDIVSGLIAATIYKVGDIMYHYLAEHPEEQNNSHNRAEEYFKQFTHLLGEHFREERSVGFYARQLCITPKYLTTLIKRISGQSVSEWIDNYVILEAKTLLKYSTMSIQEIAYYLNFPNQSFFGSYFKRNTGMSPSQYKAQN